MIVNALPFARQTNVRQSLAICRELLANAGNVLIIFPEGTRSTTGEIRNSNPASARWSRAAMSLFFPVILKAPSAPGQRENVCRVRAKCDLIVGAPRNYGAMSPDKMASTAVAAELQGAVKELQRDHASN